MKLLAILIFGLDENILLKIDYDISAHHLVQKLQAYIKHR